MLHERFDITLHPFHTFHCAKFHTQVKYGREMHVKSGEKSVKHVKITRFSQDFSHACSW